MSRKCSEKSAAAFLFDCVSFFLARACMSQSMSLSFKVRRHKDAFRLPHSELHRIGG